jgi:hypothetical protein
MVTMAGIITMFGGKPLKINHTVSVVAYKIGISIHGLDDATTACLPGMNFGLGAFFNSDELINCSIQRD